MNSAVPAGTRLGRYEVRRQIGAGGMGEVYLALDTGELGREVAVKFLPAEVAADPQRLQRFLLEARTVSRLTHQNIVSVYDFGEERGARYVVTEYVDGVTLREHMSGRRLKLHDVLDVGAQVASALVAAHEAGVVHRDIKPENVMVKRDHTVKVLDFGLAKPFETHAGRPAVDTEAGTRMLANTSPGMVLGTVSYMSPEQSRGEAVDARSDIWSLGVVLYEMLAGRLPFEGADVHRQIVAIQEQEPPPLARHVEGVPERLEEIVLKALAKDPEDRYQTAKDLLIDLKHLRHKLEVDAEIDRTIPPELRARASRSSGTELRATTAPQGAAPTTAAEGPRQTSSAEYIVSGLRRHRRVAAVAVALVLATAAAGLLFLRGRQARALTEKDTILLADFVNTTGDPVFDGTLKQALAVQLGQSPYLNIFPEDRVRETLRYMGRSPDERVTREVGREICQRQGVKALLAGSISGLGSHYVIILEAVNAQTGESLAREQAEAGSKEQVLRGLGEAAVRLREKLGESLASIKRFDAPVEQATTSSLEALRAYALGNEQRNRGDEREAIPLYRRAIELDPNFALAYGRLATIYGNSGLLERAREAAQRAFELRDRVSERERFYISEKYYSFVTGELDRMIETLELWKRTYPNDYVPRNNLAVTYRFVGQYEKAVEEAREALRLRPNTTTANINLGASFTSLNRYEEARQVFEQAAAQMPDVPHFHYSLALLAFARGDGAEVQRRLAWYAGKPFEYDAHVFRARAAAVAGRLRESRDFHGRAVELLRDRNLHDNAAQLIADEAINESAVGNCGQARARVAESLAVARTQISVTSAALALALCGDAARAQPFIDDLARRYPQDTVVNAIWLPMIRAALELSRDNPAHSLQSLQPTARYEAGNIASLWPAYLRGLAHLRLQQGAEAAAEFQKILDRRGVVIDFVTYPLAQLGLARAAALAGDGARARTAYQDFFALWKEADPDVPVLQEARREYEAVR